MKLIFKKEFNGDVEKLPSREVEGAVVFKEPESIQKRSVSVEIVRDPSRGYRGEDHAGHPAFRTGSVRKKHSGKRILVCESSCFFLCQAERHGCVSFAGDEVYRRSDRI